MKTIDIAESFVDLALKHDWRKVKELSNDEVQVLFEVVSAAGFEPQKVVLGKLVGNYLDQDGAELGRSTRLTALARTRWSAKKVVIITQLQGGWTAP